MRTDILIKKMRAIARKHGWAIGVHGSLKRDIDLIAVPWTDEAASWKVIYHLWIKRLKLWDTEGASIGLRPRRPHGRRSVIILQAGAERDGDHPKGRWKPMALDVSFMPRID